MVCSWGGATWWSTAQRRGASASLAAHSCKAMKVRAQNASPVDTAGGITRVLRGAMLHAVVVVQLTSGVHGLLVCCLWGRRAPLLRPGRPVQLGTEEPKAVVYPSQGRRRLCRALKDCLSTLIGQQLTHVLCPRITGAPALLSPESDLLNRCAFTRSHRFS